MYTLLSIKTFTAPSIPCNDIVCLELLGTRYGPTEVKVVSMCLYSPLCVHGQARPVLTR